MKKIDSHISDLLYKHDCVIVPDLGGFVANYSPAKIHPTQHSFIPPSKSIVFNINLKNNDGLLASHVAGKEKTTYPEANKIIGEYVSGCNTELRSGKKVNITKVGTLFLDVERNILFEPDKTVNYLIDSFGLSGFQSPAIKREGHIHRIEKEFKDRPPVPQERKKLNVKRYVTAALLAPLLFAAVWLPLKTDLLKNVYYSSLNPFSKKDTITYTFRTKQIDALVIDNKNNQDITKDTAAVTTINLTDNSEKNILVKLKEIVKPKHKAKAETDKTQVAHTPIERNPTGKFHVVAGCFKIYANAQRYVKQLKAKGLNAAIIGKTESDLNIVSVGDYAKESEARTEIARVKEITSEVWMLVQ